MTTESLGISVPIPGKKTIFYQKEVLLGGFHATCSVARFRFRYRDLGYHSFGSETDSESPFSLKSVPSPIPRRDLDRESRCFGSETREPGISASYPLLLWKKIITNPFKPLLCWLQYIES